MLSVFCGIIVTPPPLLNLYIYLFSSLEILQSNFKELAQSSCDKSAFLETALVEPLQK